MDESHMPIVLLYVSFNYAPPTANLCDAVYIHVRSTIPPFGAVILRQIKQIFKWTLAFTPLVLPPREPRPGGEPCRT